MTRTIRLKTLLRTSAPSKPSCEKLHPHKPQARSSAPCLHGLVNNANRKQTNHSSTPQRLALVVLTVYHERVSIRSRSASNPKYEADFPCFLRVTILSEDMAPSRPRPICLDFWPV